MSQATRLVTGYKQEHKYSRSFRSIGNRVSATGLAKSNVIKKKKKKSRIS